ncbi:hypothetical protein BJV82DRAFT_633195 [Fennellomyces sp. T-0311]|nr:hypothetical protein BJV82DRAFT_633195 [Fennellomyces sp. T-0311]
MASATGWRSMRCISRRRPFAIRIGHGATSKLGITLFPLSTGNSVPATAHLLSKTNTRWLIASEAYSQMANASTAELKGVHVDTWKSFDVEELITLAACTKDVFPRKQPKLSDIALILHSSGTTGLPKPIFLSNKWVIRMLAIFPRTTKPNGQRIMDYGETMMTTFCAFHMGGFWMYWLPITVSGSIVVLRKEPLSTADFLAIIRKRMVTFSLVAPVHLENLATLLQTEGIDQVTSDGLRKFKVCVYGGAPMADEVGNFLQSSGLNIVNGYGSTSTLGIFLIVYVLTIVWIHF